LGKALVQRYVAVNGSSGIALIGFSYGADEAIRIARRFNEAGLPVALLVTIDPVRPEAVPMNVRVCRNFYQSNGVVDLFPWLRGVPLRADGADASQLVNIDIRE